jgi:branched-chain amino acid transport system substrate-binding protein
VPRGFFDVAMAQDPKPATIAITGADVEYGKVAMDGARDLAARHGLKVVYDKSYPANIVDMTPVVRAIQVSKPDLVFVASYPTDSAGFIKAVTELSFKPKMIGGGMIGLQYAALKTQLGPLLNGVVNYELYAPEPTMDFPGIQDFLKRYQAKAAAEGIDPLGFYVPPYVYAAAQVMQQAITSTGSLDQAKIAEHIRGDEFDTVVGKIRFGENGEWAKPRPLLVQYQNIKGNGIDQFFKTGTQAIMHPPSLKSGKLIYPYNGPGQ